MAEVDVARSPLFAFADQYVNERAVLDPIFGTEIGVHEVDHLLPDFSSGQAHRNVAHTQTALEQLGELEPGDDLDRVAKAVMVERLEVRLDLERSGEDRRNWGVIMFLVVRFPHDVTFLGWRSKLGRSPPEPTRPSRKTLPAPVLLIR
jgi:hypothetical protein